MAAQAAVLASQAQQASCVPLPRGLALPATTSMSRAHLPKFVLICASVMLVGRGGRVVEGTALEMRHTRKGIVGANPTLSART